MPLFQIMKVKENPNRNLENFFLENQFIFCSEYSVEKIDGRRNPFNVIHKLVLWKCLVLYNEILISNITTLYRTHLHLNRSDGYLGFLDSWLCRN